MISDQKALAKHCFLEDLRTASTPSWYYHMYVYPFRHRAESACLMHAVHRVVYLDYLAVCKRVDRCENSGVYLNGP